MEYNIPYGLFLHHMVVALGGKLQGMWKKMSGGRRIGLLDCMM